MSVSENFRSNRILKLILDNIVWLIFLVILLVFSLTITGFFNLQNYINIVYHSVFIGILAISVSYCLICGNIDLSVESVAGLGAILTAWFCGRSVFTSGLNMNPFLALLLVMAIGGLVGAVNAFFIIKLHIDSFLVTLSSYIYVRGLAVLLTGGQGVSQMPAALRFVDTVKILNMPLMVYLMLGLYVLFYFILSNTRFGRHVYIVGGNETAAYNFGIDVKGTILRVFILSGALAGLTGWLMVARSNGSTPTVATGYLFEALAAVIIGGVSMTGGIGALPGVIGGVLLLSSIHSALNILDISPFVTDVIRGLLVLLAIVLDSVKRILR